MEVDRNENNNEIENFGDVAYLEEAMNRISERLVAPVKFHRKKKKEKERERERQKKKETIFLI